MESFLQDLRYAFRTLVKRPAFTAVAVLTLTLGIGASTAIFSFVHAVLIAPLPYEDEDRLVMLWGELRARNVREWPASAPDLYDYRQLDSFDEVAAAIPFEITLTGEGDPERVAGAMVTENLHTILGVSPRLGRLFGPEDTTPIAFDPNDPNATPPTVYVILSHGLWQRRYGGDEDIVGRRIEIAGTPVYIAGVMPDDFQLLLPAATRLPRDVDLWAAARLNFDTDNRRDVSLRILARLRSGVTVAQAQAEMDALTSRLRQELPLYNDVGFHVEVVPLHNDLVKSVRPLILALFGAVGFVLLIACTNVASLLLVRATARSQEISIRAALGGSRVRLIRNVLSESLVLSLLAALLGLALAHAGISIFSILRPVELPRMETIGINISVLGFTVLVSLVTSVIFGIVPALQTSRFNLAAALRTHAEIGGSTPQRALRSGLVVAEVALCLVLLIGAGLMVRSSIALSRVDPGFSAEGVLTFEAAVPPGVLPDLEARVAFVEGLRERIAGLPGVEAVGAARPLPLTNLPTSGRYGTEAALTDQSLFQQAIYRAVTAGYFEAMQTSVIAGRSFDATEYSNEVPVVMVDDVLARKTWPGESAVGKRLIVRPFARDPFPVDVIGVVEHQRHTDLSQEGRETVYYTHRFLGAPALMTWTVRTAVDPLTLVGAIRQEVAALNSDTPLINIRTMQSYVDSARAPTNFALLLIGIFGITALILASVGLYGVLAYAVQQRTSEIGVRMAFGARPTDILGMVLQQGMRLVIIGVVLGLAAAIVLTRFMESLLVGVPAVDPVTYVGIVLFFFAVAALACYVPAFRATRVDPVQSLQQG